MVYKLYYFPGRGWAEGTRHLFALAGVEYEDIRIDFDDWPKYKSEMPFGQLPVLEVDGVKIAQSAAIGRLVAKRLGYYGKNDIESAQIDSIVDQFKDYFNEIRPFFFPVLWEKDADKDHLFKTVYVPARDKIFGFLTNFLKNNKSGFLVGDSVSWADLVVCDHIGVIQTLQDDAFQQYRELLALKKRVDTIPAIAKWNAERPKSIF